MEITLPKQLENDIWDHCRLNSITNVEEFTLNLIKQGITISRYGATPMVKEKVVEKIVEVPVETIVEKIIQMPALPDDKLNQELLDCTNTRDKLSAENIGLTNINNTLKKELEEEKKRNKDIYGEG